jgi:hypothetical protein
MHHHFPIIIALAFMACAVITTVSFIVREMTQQIKRDRMFREYLAKLRVQQQREHLERVRAYWDVGADTEAHERELQTLLASFYPAGYFAEPDHDHHDEPDALRASGASWRTISERLGVGIGTLYKAIQPRSKKDSPPAPAGH